MPKPGSPPEVTIPPRKNPTGKRIPAQIKLRETDGRGGKPLIFRAVKPAAMLTSARAVPCACASVNMSRRMSFPTSTYQPILNPCRISRPPPNDKKIRSDHQPKRRLRSKLFMGTARPQGSLCEQNSFIVALASQSLKNILLKMPVGIKGALRLKDCVWRTHFAQPFFECARSRFAQRVIIRSVGKRKIREARQRLQRFPSVEADGRVRIGHAENEVRIKPVAAGDLLRRFPSHSPSDEGTLSALTFHDPLHRCGDGLIVLRKLRDRLVIPSVQFLRSQGEGLIKMTKIAGIWPAISDAHLHDRP